MPKPGVANISIINNRKPSIIKIMLNSGILNPDPIKDNNIAIIPKTSAPNPGEDIPKINAKIPSINNNDCSIGFDKNFKNMFLIDGV